MKTITTTTTTIALLLVACAVLGCESTPKKTAGDPPKTTKANKKADPYHCNAIEGLSVCVEYTDEAKAKAACPNFKGKVATGACPDDKLSGSCAFDGKVRKYYKMGGSPQGPSTAEKHCTKAMKGTFTANK